MFKTIIKIGLLLAVVFWAGLAQADTYRVKSGDTLGKIAGKYGVSVSRLKAWNGLKSSHIYVGQKLQINPKGKVKSTAESKNYTLRKDYYIVKKGDNLSKVAGRAHTTVKSLIKLNRLKSTVVRPGQRLLIRTRKVEKKPRSETYPGTPPLIEPKSIIEGELTFYTVKEGETLEIIAQQYDLTPEEIREANLMPEESEVKKGQILAIPQKDTTE
ncbi:MAG: LysM peptidoglycan-binding domain-containing protein [Candidatus Omnitrophota bacterium]|nr:LysM peptidoglycan-binding domain-containing protein [Candidatus Omnitrophota bacterium]